MAVTKKAMFLLGAVSVLLFTICNGSQGTNLSTIFKIIFSIFYKIQNFSKSKKESRKSIKTDFVVIFCLFHVCVYFDICDNVNMIYYLN